jgi:hypothetical protein
MATPDSKKTEIAIPTGPAHVVEVTGATIGAVGGAIEREGHAGDDVVASAVRLRRASGRY